MLLKGVSIRKQGALYSVDDFQYFANEGRPGFILCTLTTMLHNNPTNTFHVNVVKYDVSDRRKQRRLNNGV